MLFFAIFKAHYSHHWDKQKNDSGINISKIRKGWLPAVKLIWK